MHIQHALLMRKHSSKDFSLKDRWLMMVELEEKIRFPNFLNLTISEEVFYDCCAGSVSKGDFNHTENSFYTQMVPYKTKENRQNNIDYQSWLFLCVQCALSNHATVTRRYISALWCWLFRNWEKKVICGKKFHNFSLIGCTSVVEWWSYTRVFHEISYQSVTLRLGIVVFFFA